LPAKAILNRSDCRESQFFRRTGLRLFPIARQDLYRLDVLSRFRHHRRITASELQLSAEEKLNLLKELDRWRRWTSLDDRRLCLGCGQMITGHEINVMRSAELGPVEAHCPTDGCQSIPLDWILPSPGEYQVQP
jgi:hypothetical protein